MGGAKHQVSHVFRAKKNSITKWQTENLLNSTEWWLMILKESSIKYILTLYIVEYDWSPNDECDAIKMIPFKTNASSISVGCLLTAEQNNFSVSKFHRSLMICNSTRYFNELQYTYYL